MGVAGKRAAGGGGGGGAPAGGAEGGPARRAVRVVVPTGTEPVSTFSPGFWSAFDPVAFPYGDGVFGLEREAKLTYDEWCRCLMAREELEYDVPDDVSAPDSAQAPAPDAARAPAASESPVPRWRRHAYLLTAQYCLWRRKAIIQSARLFVRKQRLGESIADLAALTPEELAQVVAVLGRGAGLKQALGHEGVPR